MATLLEAAIVKVPDMWFVSANVTEVGLNVNPLAVGVRVMSLPNGASLTRNCKLELAVPLLCMLTLLFKIMFDKPPPLPPPPPPVEGVTHDRSPPVVHART